jgi:hypothetical protein
MSAGISELVSAIGKENIQYQFLDHSIDKFQRRRQVNEITFVTDQQLDPSGNRMDRAGIVLWVPRDQFEAKLKELTSKEEGAT